MLIFVESESPRPLIEAALRLGQAQALQPRLVLLPGASGHAACAGEAISLTDDDFEALAGRLGKHQPLLPLPQQVRAGEALELIYSEPMSRLCEWLEGRGLPLAEDLLEAVCREAGSTAEAEGEPAGPAMSRDLSVAQALADREVLAAAWLALDPARAAAAWSGEPGARARWLHSLALWRELAGVDLRGPLDQACRRVMADPADWPAQLVLLLYRRRYRALEAPSALDALTAPDWFRQALGLLSRGEEGFLGILPPIRDFTVTIALGTYNRLPRLQRAIASLQAQTLSDWRLLVCDDGSRDGTADYLRALSATDARVSCLYNPVNLGFNATMQRVFAACETELVLGYADDHLMRPDLLEALTGCLRAHPWAAAAGGSWLAVGDDGAQAQYGPYYPAACLADNRRELQRHAMICPLGPTWVYRHALLAEMAPYDTWCCPDGRGYALWDYLAAARLTGRYEMGYVPQVVLEMMTSNTTMSATRDNTRDMLLLLEGIVADYNRLYGRGSFPERAAAYFCHLRRLEMMNHFQKTLTHSGSLPDFKRQFAAYDPTLAAWYELHARLRTGCSASEPLLFHYDSPAFASLGLS